MKKLLMTLLAGTMISTSSFATEPSINITLSNGDTLSTSRSYSSQYSNSETDLDAAGKIKAAYDLGNMFRPANESTKDQLSRWYGNLKYTKDGIQNSPWVKKDKNIRRAWLDGYDGAGVNVLVSDDFTSRIVNHNDNQYYMPSHGEKVGLIINGGTLPDSDTQFVGIAPEANVTLKQYGDPNFNLADYDIVNYSNSGGIVTVNDDTLNMYRGWRRDHPIETPANTLFVKSAGNTTMSCTTGNTCRASSIAILTDDRRSAQTLIVGKLDSAGNIASTKAGITKDMFVVDDDNYNLRWEDSHGSRQTRLNGTSFSVPTVSAKAAIIKSKFPNLNGEQLANRIKHTADDLGAPGVDDVYGHGKVNLGRALSVVGALR